MTIELARKPASTTTGGEFDATQSIGGLRTFDNGTALQVFKIQTSNSSSLATTLQISNSSNSAFNDGIRLIHGGGVFQFTNLAGLTVAQTDLSNNGQWIFGTGTATANVTHKFIGTTGDNRHTILRVEGSIASSSLSVNGSGTNGSTYMAMVHDRFNITNYFWINSGGASAFKFAAANGDTWTSPVTGMTGYLELASVTTTAEWTFGRTTAANITHVMQNNSTTNFTAQLFNHDTSTSSDGTASLTLNKGSTTNNTNQRFMLFRVNDGNTLNGSITANGANTAVFTTTSDRRLKENIVDLPSQLDKIMALRPVEFDYRENADGYGTGHQVGFIAQEMLEVYPDVVQEQQDGYLAIAGWDKTTSRLVKAIQELAADYHAYKLSHP